MTPLLKSTIPLALVAITGLIAPALADDKLAFFEGRIRPVLVKHCYDCHSASAGKAEGGLLVDTRAGLIAGGENGPAVVPGKPAAGSLLAALKHDGFEMPKDQPKLSNDVIADFESWIKGGAVDPRSGPAAAPRTGIDFNKGREHWAFRPVQVVAPAVAGNSDWPRGEIDRYILARLQIQGLVPAADADAFALLRRLFFDLTGLPPSVADVDAFLVALSPPGGQNSAAKRAAARQKAVEAVVERLLASLQFGEHWARHWLDGVRFNSQLTTIEAYRDWVVRAHNGDLPYDQFVIRQLAGDLLPAASPAERDEHLIAGQLLCLNVREMDRVEGMIEVVGQQLLGVSLNCAKCHDHKFDPFSQQDYYGLAGIFTSTKVIGDKNPQIDGQPLATRPGYKIISLTDDKIVSDTNLLYRGERDQRGPVVPRRFPQVLAGDKQTPLGNQTADSGRLLLARWIASADNPLTARVIVNRVWLRMFGRGIVATPNDFGTQGEPPTHPELLDYLADRLVRSGWSLKSLIRELALSRTYQQGTTADPATIAADADNRWLARARLRRLQYEQLIDSLLATSGTLQTGPPPPNPKKRPFDYRFGGKEPIATTQTYRALYHDDAVMRGLFDGPDPELLVDQREASVTAPQLLFFMNHPTVAQIAAVAAARSEEIAGTSELPPRVDAVHRLFFARPATAAEQAAAAEFLSKSSLARYCHVLLASSEFLYLE
ncbi:MAG: PSD1 and planctomycete cytochrome C domain-containing protein [Pirellulaceae bacterium]|nr:PSD1 and planctomycete cytochrome C domain-containing protein [Pirellulaceae bacterium]